MEPSDLSSSFASTSCMAPASSARERKVAGQREAAEASRELAREALNDIADPEDRQLIEQDLETTPL